MVVLHWYCMEMMGKTLHYQEDDGANRIVRPARFKSTDLTDRECCDSAPLAYRGPVIGVIGLSKSLRPCRMNAGTRGSGWRAVSDRAAENLGKSTVDRHATVL